MRKAALTLLTIFWWLAATAAMADTVVIELVVKDAKFRTPRFDAPSVRYEIRESDDYAPDQTPITAVNPGYNVEDDGYYFFKEPFDRDVAANNYAHFVIDSLGTSEYLPVNAFLLRLRLNSARINSGPVIQEIAFDHRSTIAELYKRQVYELTRVINPTDEQNESAYSAAKSAVTLDPSVDNFLLFSVALKHSLRTGQDVSAAPLTVAQLRAYPGYEALDFGSRWTIQTEVLDTLTAAPDLERRLDPTRTVIDAAIALATEMIEQVDFSNPEHTKQRVVRVYQALSYLHARNGDCFSLGENNAHAIEQSAAIDMNWPAQRVLMLDWGDCLERMTGIGEGGTREEIAAKTADDRVLKAQWEDYLSAADLISDRLRFASGDAAERLDSLVEFARMVEEEGSQ